MKQSKIRNKSSIVQFNNNDNASALEDEQIPLCHDKKSEKKDDFG